MMLISNLKQKKFLIVYAPIIFSLIITLLIIFLSKHLPPKLPIFYSLPWGDKQLGSIQQLFILPAIIILISLFNLVISWQLHEQQTYFKSILFFSSLLVTIILTITFFKIVFIFI